ncbi:MBL fold metallo-hydrolase [Motiliproteus sp. MSK22-1]|uniref:MBL fold metallo-hydrolase n=1 Tax=Motiliproteus sp. MSK22-1 TaxID=1897630 RepID=UPI0009771C8E|nr:MBL fold metallo-hydrolase [Motiliproteus sp. MSK22-1]OMH32101.1 Zn-dependent hydrolase [Motiliproteus sp. MSK22-1]
MFKKVFQITHSLLLVIAAFAAQATSHDESPSFKALPLTDNISMLQGRGGNLAVLSGKQGILLIDDDFKAMSDALKAELSNYGGLDKLTYIINTHWHGDHTQGNLALGDHAQIVAHDNVRTRLLTRQEIKLFNMVSEPYPEAALPSITYQQAMTLYINGEEINVVHYPNGHTDGDSIVYFKNANVVHMGDHFFSGFFPFVDISSGGNVLKMAANIEAVLHRVDDQTKIIPGHGPLSSKSDLRAFHEMLVGTAAEVKAMKDKGMSQEQAQKEGLSDQWNEWTDGFLSTESWIGIVYQSL